MCNILNAVITAPEDFKAEYATTFDFYFLMYKMRTVSYGNIYKVSTKCPNCGKEQIFSVDLDKMEVKYLPEDFKEPFKIGPLPRSKDVLECRFDRVIDEINNERTAKDILSKNPNYEGSPSAILTMCSRIVSVNGEKKTPIEMQMYVEELPAMDAAYFVQAYNKATEGVGMSTECSEVCTGCGETVTFGLPFNSEFFRPTFDL
jgi:rRNA maturation protein Nop10